MRCACENEANYIVKYICLHIFRNSLCIFLCTIYITTKQLPTFDTPIPLPSFLSSFSLDPFIIIIFSHDDNLKHRPTNKKKPTVVASHTLLSKKGEKVKKEEIMVCMFMMNE